MQACQNTFVKRRDSLIKKYFFAVRPAFLTASILPVLLGSAVGYYSSGLFDALALLLALCAVALVNAGVNVFNDVYDDIGGSDRVNTTHVFPFTGGSRLIQDHTLSVLQMYRWSVTLLSLGVALGTLLLLYKGFLVLVFGVTGVFLGIAYSLPPLELSARGLGESAVAFGVGVLPVTGAAWLQSGDFNGLALLLSLAVSLWVANILLINEVPDAAADAAADKRTLVVRLGYTPSAWLYLVSNLAACGFVALCAGLSLLPSGVLWLPLAMVMPACYAGYTIYNWNRKLQWIRKGIIITIAIHAVNILWLTFWLVAQAAAQ